MAGAPSRLYAAPKRFLNSWRAWVRLRAPAARPTEIDFSVRSTAEKLGALARGGWLCRRVLNFVCGQALLCPHGQLLFLLKEDLPCHDTPGAWAASPCEAR